MFSRVQSIRLSPSPYRRLPPSTSQASSSRRGFIYCNPAHRDLRNEEGAAEQTSWKTTIGLELHVQLKSPVKLFSPATTSYEAVPNEHVSIFDAALPGSLPVLNPEPVRLAVLAALALNCTINLKSKFDRKHYFYPDLPNGFQITQKYSAIATNGRLHLTKRHDGLDHAVSVGISQLQLEQDTAKSTHDAFTSTTLIDLNRAGTPLVEIVSEPDMHSPQQAAAYVRKVQSLLRCVGASDADMEKGSLRIDVNVSVSKAGDKTLGTRCEIKNLNSIRSMTDAIQFEVERHISVLDSGKAEVEQETRGFDAVTGATFKLRSKADAPDYRYMPDPELAPLIIEPAQLGKLKSGMPELPDQTRDRLESSYKLAPREVDILVKLDEHSEASDGAGVRFFERVVVGRNAKVVSNWILHELLGQLTKNGLTFSDNPVTASDLGSIIDAVSTNKINTTTGKALLATFVGSPSARTLASLLQEAIQAAAKTDIDYPALVADIIAGHPTEVAKIRKGQKNVLARLVGQGMKKTSGRADAMQLRKHLEAELT